METVKITYMNKRIKPSFGSMNFEVDYLLHHVKYGRVNDYLITCRIEGIECHDLELIAQSAEWQGNMETDSNDETLTDNAAMQLFEDHLSD